MKQITLAIALISLLASCSESRSGKREPNYSIVRVKMVNDSSTIDWVRLNTVETKVYRVGDTVRMNLNVHTIVTPGASDADGSSLVVLDSLVGK
jgi:hypothetical protein